jgi:ubiquinone/menaquinone biosynthesis C-methylase UbiE
LDAAYVSEVVTTRCSSSDTVSRLFIDIGCGTGRSIEPLRDKGWRTLGIDLSREMLAATSQKLDCPDMLTSLVQANMVQLEGFRDEIADGILCLYSSIGMIRGRENRRTMLRHVRRMLKPNGFFVVHVHNRGNWWTFREGILMTIRSFRQSLLEKEHEHGDRIYPYRSLPSMFLHIFSRRELLTDLSESGFNIEVCRALNSTSSDWLRTPSWLPHFRAGGFVVTAIRPT